MRIKYEHFHLTNKESGDGKYYPMKENYYGEEHMFLICTECGQEVCITFEPLNEVKLDD